MKVFAGAQYVVFAVGLSLLAVGVVTYTHVYRDPVELSFDVASQKALR